MVHVLSDVVLPFLWKVPKYIKKDAISNYSFRSFSLVFSLLYKLADYDASLSSIFLIRIQFGVMHIACQLYSSCLALCWVRGTRSDCISRFVYMYSKRIYEYLNIDKMLLHLQTFSFLYVCIIVDSFYMITIDGWGSRLQSIDCFIIC